MVAELVLRTRGDVLPDKANFRKLAYEPGFLPIDQVHDELYPLMRAHVVEVSSDLTG